MRSAIPLVLSSLVLLAGCPDGGGGGGGPTGYATCGAGGTCSAGKVCDTASNTCVPDQPCAVGGCTPGYVCDPVSDRCELVPGCFDATGCPTGWSCVSGECVEAVPGGCTSDSQCGTGLLCDEATGSCGTTAPCGWLGWCPAHWTCESSLCVPLEPGTCVYDQDCGTGEHCSSGFCTGCATAGTVCAGQSPACSAAGNACVECNVDGDCLPGLRCLTDSYSYKVCTQCLLDSDCTDPALPKCYEGYCHKCASYRDCGTGAGEETCYPYLDLCLPDAALPCKDTGCAATPERPYCDGGFYSQCMECLHDEHCAAGERCEYGGRCRPRPPGDACDAPMALPLTGAGTLVAMDLGGYACNDAGCTVDYNSDAYWTLTLAAPTTLQLRLGSVTYPGTLPALELRTPGCSTRILDHSFLSIDDVMAISLPAGDYVLRLIGLEYTSAPYTILINSAPATLAAGNRCDAPAVLGLSGGAASVTGSTTGFAPVSGDYCASGAPGGDAVYALDLAERSWVSLTATPTDATHVLGLDVKDACLPEYAYGCNVAPGAPVTRTFRGAEPGRRYVVVHSEAGTSGPFRLDVTTARWPANDVCAGAQPLDLSAGSATVTGSTGDDASLQDNAFQCPSGGTSYAGNDQFFTFSSAGLGDRKLVLTVTPDGGSWQPALALETTCGAQSSLQCVIGSTGSAATLTRDVLEAGSYTVHVTAVSGTGGPYTLTASLSEPVYAANDACDAPATVPLYSGTLAGDSRGATDSVGPTCAPGTARDLSYQVTLAPRGRVWVEVTPASTSFDPVIVTQANCGGAETACWNSAGPGGVETADFLVDGSASFWVDGADGTEGAFTVRGTSTWSAPDNDLCTARTALALATATPPVPISASGSVIAAFSDGGCAGGAVDTFYEVQSNWTGGGAKPIRVRLTPYEFVGKLTVYADCLATTCGTSVTGAGVGAEVTLPLSIAQGARVIVAVSSADGGISSYSISAGQ